MCLQPALALFVENCLSFYHGNYAKREDMKNTAQRVEVPRGSSERATRRTEGSTPDGRIRFSLSSESPESLNRKHHLHGQLKPHSRCPQSQL